MFVIGVPFTGRHAVVLQFLPCFAQPRSFRIRLDFSGFQVVHPFFQWRLCDLVELVHADDVIFREDLPWVFGQDGILLLGRDLQFIGSVHADETVLPVVEVVVALSQIEIDDADGVHLLDVSIALT